MKLEIKKCIALLLIFVMLLITAACAQTPEEPVSEQLPAQEDVSSVPSDEPVVELSASAVLEECAGLLLETVTEPTVNSVAGEWAVLGLARWDGEVPQAWFTEYYQRVEDTVKASSGVLHEKKHTEYSRVILALTAIGKDPKNVAGYDLTLPLGDYDKTVWQGNNGAVWALIALDSGNWEIPENTQATVQATRSMYVQQILSTQQEDGGWCLSGVNTGTASDPDITCMALQALAKYQAQPAVANAVKKAMQWLSEQQSGFVSSESFSQLIVTLCELGISLDDERFTADGKTAVDMLLNYYRPGEGFCHNLDSEKADLMATEQAFYALVAWNRAEQGRSSLYDMTDVQ